jgi:uncharacterized protein (TIGR00296 family)
MMQTDDGITAVKIARSVITQEVTKKQSMYTTRLSYNEKCGVFVTINTYPALDLRGCIGFPGPSYPLLEALEHAARSACHDPRFKSLKESELEKVVVEVTILTPPEPMIVDKREELLNVIKIGKHGLMLEYKGRRGVFLPQVPVEWDWNVTEYLENLCMKAGIPKDKWKEDDCKIMSFEGRIFKELSPNGDVAEC